MPLGLWKVESPENLKKGDVILFCPNDNPLFRTAKSLGYLKQGTCRGGFSPLLKEIVAVDGDSVTLDDEIKVNGKSFGPIISETYGLIQAEKPSSGAVAKGKIWVIGTSSLGSFDSRYFGAIQSSEVSYRAKPVFTW